MPVNLLIVDDSAVARRMLAEFVADDPEIRLIGTASDPLIAREKIKALAPDVVSLDIEMPHMDGLQFLTRIMALRPMPVVVVSALSDAGTETSVRALELGAVDVMAKPGSVVGANLAELAAEFRRKLKAAARAKVGARAPARAVVAPLLPARAFTDGLIALGASTGGVEALGTLLAALPPDIPPVVVTQHMPRGFTANFARRLDARCALHVVEAEPGTRLLPGTVAIAPGDLHLEIMRQSGGLVCRLSDAPPVSGHRPSVDFMFTSIARLALPRCAAAILTGMGQDGATGLGALRQSGALTLGQNEASCVVYGMPRAAREAGAVMRELPLSEIGPALLAPFCQEMAHAPPA